MTRSLACLRFLVATTALALAGCADDQPSCVAPFDVAAWCDASGRCTEGGAPASCESGAYCNVRKGVALEIPIADFHATQPARDLWVGYTNVGQPPVYPAISAAIVTIDDIAGSHQPVPPENDAFTSWVTWSPPIDDPQMLHIRFTDGHVPIQSITIGLHDGACEVANPPEVIPL